MNQSPSQDIIESAKQLLWSAFQGVMASHSVQHSGYPFGSLLPFSIGRDGWPLMLLSHLAQHTKNLTANPCCNLTMVEPGTGDIQMLTRLSCIGDATPLQAPDDSLCRRHFRYYPESEIYYRELNFHFFQLSPLHFHCVAGFGVARWIGVQRMHLENPFSYDREEDLLTKINQQYAGQLPKPPVAVNTDTMTEAVGLDAKGLDLRSGEHLYRQHFDSRIRNEAAVFIQLEKLLNDKQ